MSLLRVNDLRAGYGDTIILDGINFEVESEEIVCLIGPNGAGKSTLFKCIYTFLEPSEGSIEYKGEDITGLPQKELLRNGVAYVLQSDGIFPDMTVRENVELGAYVAERSFDTDGKIEEMYDLFPILREKSSAKAKTLSGGQRQMLELARGLMLDPDLMLLDEPTAGLDPDIIGDVFQRIREINEQGVTILMIEQNIKTGLRYADRGLVLDRGQIVYRGKSNELLERDEIREAYIGVK